MAAPLDLSFDLEFDEAIAAARARGVMLPDSYYAQLQDTLRRVSTTVSGLTSLDQIEAVIASVTDALTKGESFADWQRMAELRNWELPPGRLETIFRTNVQTAYSAGHWQQFRETQNSRPYLMWSAINDSRVRPTHLAMDGYIAAIDDPIWQIWHVPAGYNCRCSQISLSASQAEARGLGRKQLPDAMPDPGFGGGEPGSVTESLAKAIEARRATSSVGRGYLDSLEAGLAG